MSCHTLPLPSDPAPNAFEALAEVKATLPKTLTATVEPLLLDTDQSATLCGVSVASWFRLKAAGKTPAPVKLGGRVLYRVEDLRLWVAWGCPDRKTFEARKAAENSNGRSR
jgi:predicted DNA-binding transcriptional regulator AlpA